MQPNPILAELSNYYPVSTPIPADSWNEGAATDYPW